jgi:multidrug efflux system outer membrane protein
MKFSKLPDWRTQRATIVATTLYRMQRRAIPFLLVPFVSGCFKVGPDYAKPEIPVASSFVGEAEVQQVATPKGQVVESWWRSFNDATLNRFIEESVRSNNDLETSLARVNQARAIRQETFLDLFPTVTSQGSYTETRIPTSTFAGDAFQSTQSHINNQYYSAGFDAVWELDLFGRVRREVEAKDAESAASVAELRDAIRIVVSEVARNYFILRGTQQQIGVAQENAKTQSQVVKIAEALFKGGQSTEFDVVRAKAQYSNTMATIPALQARAKAAMYRLAVLCGKQPADVVPELTKVEPLPHYVGPITLSDPAGLLQRRPDIRAAEARLEAATAGIGVAKGDLFPKVTFNGSISLQARSPNGFGSGDSDSYRMLPTITWPAFNLGRVFANIDRADAVRDAALAQYEKSVLEALEDTESALAQFGASRERRDLLADSVHNSSRAVQIARTQYENGLVDLLPVLDAQRVALASELELSQSQTELLTSLVALFKALGGGWDAAVVEQATEEQAPLQTLSADVQPVAVNAAPNQADPDQTAKN